MTKAVERATKTVVRVSDTKFFVEIPKEEALRVVETADDQAVSLRKHYDGSVELLEGIGRYNPNNGAFTYLPVAGPG